MPTIAGITIPESDTALVFPLPIEYPFVTVQTPTVVAHQFNSGDRKIQQRFLIGANTRRFTVNFGQMPKNRYQLLTDFFASVKGPYSTFLLNDPNGSGQIRVRFADENMTVQMAMDCVASGESLTLAEVPATTPEYTISASVNRFPTSDLNTDLLSQTQEIIPLIKIIPQDTSVNPIYISDRKVSVGGTVYEPRLCAGSA
jgi:hypothetical protein